MSISFRNAVISAGVMGAIAAVAVFSLNAEAVTVQDAFDTDRAVVNVDLRRLPDAGCVVQGCATVPSQYGEARGCTSFELARASNRNACNALLDLVVRRSLSSKGFPLDAGE